MEFTSINLNILHGCYINYSYFFSRCDRCLFSATFLPKTPGNNSLHVFFILPLCQLSFITISINMYFSLFLLFDRSRWTSSLQKSRPTLTTSRTREYGAIFWHNVAVNRYFATEAFCDKLILRVRPKCTHTWYLCFWKLPTVSLCL